MTAYSGTTLIPRKACLDTFTRIVCSQKVDIYHNLNYVMDGRATEISVTERQQVLCDNSLEIGMYFPIFNTRSFESSAAWVSRVQISEKRVYLLLHCTWSILHPRPQRSNDEVPGERQVQRARKTYFLQTDNLSTSRTSRLVTDDKRIGSP